MPPSRPPQQPQTYGMAARLRPPAQAQPPAAPPQPSGGIFARLFGSSQAKQAPAPQAAPVRQAEPSFDCNVMMSMKSSNSVLKSLEMQCAVDDLKDLKDDLCEDVDMGGMFGGDDDDYGNESVESLNGLQCEAAEELSCGAAYCAAPQMMSAKCASYDLNNDFAELEAMMSLDYNPPTAVAKPPSPPKSAPKPVSNATLEGLIAKQTADG